MPPTAIMLAIIPTLIVGLAIGYKFLEMEHRKQCVEKRNSNVGPLNCPQCSPIPPQLQDRIRNAIRRVRS